MKTKIKTKMKTKIYKTMEVSNEKIRKVKKQEKKKVQSEYRRPVEEAVKWTEESKQSQRYPVSKFRRGNPLDGRMKVVKSRQRGVYGCGKTRAKYRCRVEGVSDRAIMDRVDDERVVTIEKRTKQLKMNMGSARLRFETEKRQREIKTGTIRGKKISRGLPVRGQRTVTNGKTARKRNGKRGK